MALSVLAAGCGSGEEPAPPGSAGATEASVAPALVDVTSSIGIDFVHETGERGEQHSPEIMAPGAGVFDADGDGDLDVYLVDGTRSTPPFAPDGEHVNRLYVQESPWRFVDATAASGLGDPGYGMGVAVGDVDADGDRDVLVTNLGVDRLYRNDGTGTFRGAELGDDAWSCSAAFLDFDRDGHLDLFVTQYVAFDPGHPCFDSAGRPDYCGPKEFPPVPDVLFQNDGRGGMLDVSEPSGIAAVAAAGLGVVVDDWNDDGWPDLYVANDAYANNLWVNGREGTFRDEALFTGCAYNLNGQPEAGMGVLSEDLTGDGKSDLFVSHLGQETNTLYVGAGAGLNFRDGTGGTGLGRSSMKLTGFGTAAFDCDLDGHLDLGVVNGRVYHGTPPERSDVGPPWDAYAEPNLFYLGDGAGRFRDPGPAYAAFTGRVEVSRGLVAADLDADGDLDVLVTNAHGPPRVYRNEAAAGGAHWLGVRLRDTKSGWADPLGTRVALHAGGKLQVRTVRTDSGYLTAGPGEARFGLGEAASFERIEVRWPDGVKETFPGGPADRRLELVRGEGER